MESVLCDFILDSTFPRQNVIDIIVICWLFTLDVNKTDITCLSVWTQKSFHIKEQLAFFFKELFALKIQETEQTVVCHEKTIL